MNNLNTINEGLFQKIIDKIKKINKNPPKKEIINNTIIDNKPIIINQANLREAYNNSYYTIEGAGGDLQDWVKWFNNELVKEKIGKPVAWYTAKGSQVNKEFGLKGKWAYPPNFTFLFFPLDGLSNEISTFKLIHRNRWFDDIINNSIYHMNHENYNISEVSKMSKLSKEEFENILEECFMEGYNSALEEIFNESEDYIDSKDDYDVYDEESGHDRHFLNKRGNQSWIGKDKSKKIIEKKLDKMNERMKKDDENFEKYKKGELTDLKKRLKFNHDRQYSILPNRIKLWQYLDKKQSKKK